MPKAQASAGLPHRRSWRGSPNKFENDSDGMHSNIFSGSISSVSSAEDADDEYVPVDDVVAFKKGIPAHEKAFDSLSSLRSELLNRPHLQNEEDTSIITTMIADLNEETLHLAHDLCNTLTKYLSRSGKPRENLNTPLRFYSRKRDLMSVAKALKVHQYVNTAIQHYRTSASDFTVDYLLEPMIQHALLGYLVEDVFCHFIPAADRIHPSSTTFDDPVGILYKRLQGANRRLAGTWRAVAYLAATESRDLTSLVRAKSSVRLEELHRVFTKFRSSSTSKSNGISLDRLMTAFSLRLQRIYQSAWAIQDKIRIAYLDIDFSVFVPTTGERVDHRNMRLAPEHHKCLNKRCVVVLNARLGLRAWRKRVNTVGIFVSEDIVFLKPDILCKHGILNN